MPVEEFFKLYFEYVDKNTESAFVYHRWSAIGAVGTLLARKVTIPLGHLTLYTNMYLQIIGKSGCRKSSAIKIAVDLLKDAGYTSFAPKRCSKEAFLSKLSGVKELELPDLEDTDDVFGLEDSKASDILIAADEFNAFLGTTFDEFLEILSELYDTPDVYDKWLQKGASAIRKPYVFILSGNTPSGFRLKFKGASLNQGILTRFLIIPWHETRQKIAFPERADPEKNKKILEVFKKVAKVEGTVKYTDEAMVILADIYENWKIPTPIHMEQYVERRYVHLLKLCAIFSAIEDTLVVTASIVINANTILATNERKMATAFVSIFDNAEQSLLRSVILDVLLNSPEGISALKLYNLVKVQCPKWSHVITALDTLVIQNEIMKASNGTYLLVKKGRDKVLDKYLNLDFLTKEERLDYENS